jgi:hypothetical protein
VEFTTAGQNSSAIELPAVELNNPIDMQMRDKLGSLVMIPDSHAKIADSRVTNPDSHVMNGILT